MTANPLLTFGDIVLGVLVVFVCLGGIWMTRHFDRQINALSRRIRTLEEGCSGMFPVDWNRGAGGMEIIAIELIGYPPQDGDIVIISWTNGFMRVRDEYVYCAKDRTMRPVKPV